MFYNPIFLLNSLSNTNDFMFYTRDIVYILDLFNDTLFGANGDASFTMTSTLLLIPILTSNFTDSSMLKRISLFPLIWLLQPLSKCQPSLLLYFTSFQMINRFSIFSLSMSSLLMKFAFFLFITYFFSLHSNTKGPSSQPFYSNDIRQLSCLCKKIISKLMMLCPPPSVFEKMLHPLSWLLLKLPLPPPLAALLLLDDLPLDLTKT
jgi:hypothetical protein